uniref:Glumitocin n=1 Tax=Raja clavata TaxID=7781 RepID=OXYT_RAJCL|nr:RecName: Full=Glumitocin [Raja clavata]prf//650768A glumitocin [Dipturus batis]prf//671036A glumitocin [Raja sp.]
CYISNCPQG